MQDDSVKLRKYENILTISGIGVIAFGLWSVIKAALYFIVQPLDIVSIMPTEEVQALGDLKVLMNGVVLGMILFVLMLDLLLRIYIGRSAIAVGRGRKKKKTIYIILAVFVGMSLAGSISASINTNYQEAKALYTRVMEEIHADGESAAPQQESGEVSDQDADAAAEPGAAADPDVAVEPDAAADPGSAADQEKLAEEKLEKEVNRAAVSIFVDMTSLLAIIEMIIASIQVRRLRKKLQQEA